MARMNMVQAINGALREEMRRDPRVVVLGEDVGRNGGVFRCTEGLLEEFGAARVMDTPLAEMGIVGTAIGMATYGLRPVAEIQFQDFIYPAYDQLFSEAAKSRYRSGGDYPVPLVVRTPYGGGVKGGPYHSQSGEAHFIHAAGLKVVVPATPADAKGLLIAAIRDPDPVVFLEPKRLYRAATGEVADGDALAPIGKARIVREGHDATLLAWGAMVAVCEEAAALAEQRRGARCEILDLRSLLPFDREAILASVTKTGRAVIVHEAPRTGGFGAELSAQIVEHAMLHLQAPPLRVTGYDTPFPFALEHAYLPDSERVLAGIEEGLAF